MTNLKNLRQSVSGVSLDEEFANMIKFQQGYQASAKFVSAMNDMLNILMSVAR
ncbi:MAG TPA: flagellar basal body rod C-terminal domain-containing protein [bacterium]|nr:flagellar basal body rod C-terminal domain-containing protein [bacterium]